MKGTVANKLAKVEADLRRCFNAVIELPRGIPAKLRFKILKDEVKSLSRERRDPELAKIWRDFPDTITVIHGCSGYCPTCRILAWCECVREEYSARALDWMIQHREYPPAEFDVDSPLTGETSLN